MIVTNPRPDKNLNDKDQDPGPDRNQGLGQSHSRPLDDIGGGETTLEVFLPTRTRMDEKEGIVDTVPRARSTKTKMSNRSTKKKRETYETGTPLVVHLQTRLAPSIRAAVDVRKRSTVHRDLIVKPAASVVETSTDLGLQKVTQQTTALMIITIMTRERKHLLRTPKREAEAKSIVSETDPEKDHEIKRERNLVVIDLCRETERTITAPRDIAEEKKIETVTEIETGIGTERRAETETVNAPRTGHLVIRLSLRLRSPKKN